MGKHWNEHIGDDQLIYGMPKHMSSVGAKKQISGSILGDPPYRTPPDKEGKITYWTVHPKDEACEKCKAMEGIKFKEKPVRPHPNASVKSANTKACLRNITFGVL